MVTSIPRTQKAIVTTTKGQNFHVEVKSDYPVPEPQQGEILVRLLFSGVCHSDLSVMDGSWGQTMVCDITGHEGSGYIVKHGPGVDPTVYPVGTRVGVQMIANPCRNCDACLQPDGEVYCLRGKHYHNHLNGSWQQYIIIYASYVVPIPTGIKDYSVVAPVLCGGVTSYKALKVSGARAGQWVVVSGAGGGLGSFAIQYGVALGFRIIAIDSGVDKEKMCKQLGAERFVDYAVGNTVAAVQEITAGKGARAAVILAPSEKSYNEAIEYLGVGGTIVCVGLPNSDVHLKVSPFAAVLKNVKVVGTLLGTRADIQEALEFVERGKVTPFVQVYPMEEIDSILKAMTEASPRPGEPYNTLLQRASVDMADSVDIIMGVMAEEGSFHFFTTLPYIFIEWIEKRMRC